MDNTLVKTITVAPARLSKTHNFKQLEDYKTTVVEVNRHRIDSKPPIDKEQRNEFKTTIEFSDDKSKIDEIISKLKTCMNETNCNNPTCHSLKQFTKKLMEYHGKKFKYEEMDPKVYNSVVVTKDEKIKDLERLVEDQRKLRLQDATQVEEKAAKIKEWVSNKLKELENQNKLLREQNKKQKEKIGELTDSLSVKLGQNNISIASEFSDRNTNIPIHPRFILEKQCQEMRNSSQTISNLPKSYKNNFITSCDLQTRALLSPKRTISTMNSRQESPIYDSVTLECQDGKSKYLSLKDKGIVSSTRKQTQSPSPPPPPPPLHQSEKWELKLYRLADESFSSMIENSSDDSNEMSPSFTSQESSSKSIVKDDLISILSPSFTTINGDLIVDFNNTNPKEPAIHKTASLDSSDSFEDNKSYDCFNMPSTPLMKRRFPRNFAENNNCQTTGSKTDLVNPTLGLSPMHHGSRNNVFRTQSIRKNPLPEKLYDFIVADLVKKGSLIKHGALKSNNRWVVLKDFHLLIYKSQLDESSKLSALVDIRLQHRFQVVIGNQTNDNSFPFKLITPEKTFVFIASDYGARNEWIKILSLAISLSYIDSQYFHRSNVSMEGIVSMTRHALNKRTYATLFEHILFFLRSPVDPTPFAYVLLKDALVKEITNRYNYDEEISALSLNNNDCIVEVVPKFCQDGNPVYMIIGDQVEADKWIHFLTKSSCIQQMHGTQYENALSNIMILDTLKQYRIPTDDESSFGDVFKSTSCSWRQNPTLSHSDKPIEEPLTSLPNETLKMEAIEMFKSIILFSQVPIEVKAVDYHVCLLQNILAKFMDHPELRNEFYAQLLKQISLTDKMQLMKILSIVVSLDIPKGRIRSWFSRIMKESADENTEFGKYALFILKAFERTVQNGPRELNASRQEILAILMRNPYDHSHPHSLPVNFSDKSYIVVEADGSTTAEEFMYSISRQLNIRPSNESDFYLFTDDPASATDIHILEPCRKIFDSVSWWEQASKQKNSGKFEISRSIKLICKKRLVLAAENDETDKEKSLIVYQIHNEIIAKKIIVPSALTKDLSALMAQITSLTDSHSQDNKKRVKETLAGRDVQDCIRIYLNCVRKINNAINKIHQ